MTDWAAGLLEPTRALIAEQVESAKRLLLRSVQAAIACKHGRQADQCGECRGMTAHGTPMDIVLEAFREADLLTAELVVAVRQSGAKPIQHRRPLKTLIGVGVGVSFFVGLAWQGGKLIARIVRR